MPNSDAPWELLARHLAAELDADGQAALRAWLREDAQHLQILTTVTRAWERAGEAAPAPVLFTPAQVAAAWQRFRPLMETPVAARPTANKFEQKPVNEAVKEAVNAPAGRLRLAVSARRGAGRLLRRGAFYLLPLVALAYGFARLGGPAAPAVSHYDSAARPRFVRLPDGSGVWLNARSRLDYAARPDGGPRSLRLVGEAYFDVRPLGAARPFLLSTATARVRVVGTAFNVRAYAAEDSVEVSVRHGRVWFRPLSPEAGAGTGPDSLLLTADTRAALRATDAPGRLAAALRRRPAPDRNYLAWQTDTLRFADAPVSGVLRTLQATFGTRVQAPAGLLGCRFTGTFAHPQASAVLGVLAAATGSRLSSDGGGGFVLQGAGCAAAPSTSLQP